MLAAADSHGVRDESPGEGEGVVGDVVEECERHEWGKADSLVSLPALFMSAAFESQTAPLLLTLCQRLS